MKKIIKRYEKIICCLTLIILSSLVYHAWLSFSVFVNGDWRFFSKESLISFFFPNIWTNGFGDINITLWKYPSDIIGGVFGYLGFASNFSEKFLYLWPIIFVAPISSFLLVKKITKSNLAGFIGSLVFSYNTYFLSIDTQGHEPLTIAYSIAVFAILSFIYLLETKRKVFIPLTALLLFIVGSYDLRSLYVAAGAIVLYAFYHQLIIEKKWLVNLIANVLNSFLTFFVLGLLNLYWVLPFIAAKTLTSNAILSREILAGSFYNLQSATALFYPFWTGAEPTWFFVQKIPLAFWLYPLLAFIGLIVAKKNKQIGFFGLLAVIGIFLTKQDSPPFAIVYTFLYAHLPGFDAFREASKFYFLISISYAVLIGAFTSFIWEYLRNRKYLKYLLIFLITLLPLWNTVPLLTGTINTMFISKTVPSGLSSVNSYLNSQSNYSNVLWVNYNDYWVFSTDSHPVVNGSVGGLKSWASLASINLSSLDLDSNRQTDGQKLLKFINSNVGRRMLSLGSFGYIVVNKEKNDWTNYNSSVWSSLGNSLKSVDYLKQVDIKAQNTLLFSDEKYMPYIYLTFEKESITKDVIYRTVDFNEISPSEYNVSVKDINKPFYLNFSYNYNPSWNLYVGKLNWLNVLLNKRQTISGKNHFQNVVGFNSFYIDPTQVCKVEKCAVNKDGSYNLSLTLIFKPQAYLYAGLIISVITLFSTILAVLYFYKRKL